MATLESDNKRVATAFLRAIADGDGSALEALLAPDFHWWVAGWGERSRVALLTALARTMAGFSTRGITVTGITAEGERVAVEAEGRFERPGLVYANTYHYLFIVRDGQIACGREYFDTAAASAAFGPPPAISTGKNHDQ
nr:nuclear transport factor 2 family protein [uncultured Albidiferax sp.]